MKKPYLVTGVAGFIGSSLCLALLRKKLPVVGVDNFSENYDPHIKERNLLALKKFPQFTFHKEDILNQDAITLIFKKHRPEIVFHLAALAGVRASLQKPKLYAQVNVTGSKIIYQAAKYVNVKKFIFTSSSSVYGNSATTPFNENLPLNPLSPYAKTKQQAELQLRTLHQKSHLPIIILRLFSVYGPSGRPDMAPSIFTKAALHRSPITVYGDGTSSRDYTYIDDVVRAFMNTIEMPIFLDTINIGNSSPIQLAQLIRLVEKYTHHRVTKKFVNARSEEPSVTYADITRAKSVLNWKPSVAFSKGMQKFIAWYKANRI